MDSLEVHERLANFGTTLRFAVLIVLLLVSSGSIMGGVSGVWFSDSGCLLAAGGDPNSGDSAVQAVIQANYSAYASCEAAHFPTIPWWEIIAWPLGLAAVSALIFWLLPRRKARRGRVVPLRNVDRDGTIERELAVLAAQAGLRATPRIVVDLARTSAGAVVFGTNRHPIVCLYGGLLVRRVKDSGIFRAVVLHEFAHVKNGDVTLAYVTVGLWRAFLAVVLLPFAIWTVLTTPHSASSPYWHAEEPSIVRGAVFVLAMVVLVYLAYCDVLRSRELSADLTAVSCGANRKYWAFTDPEAPRTVYRRAWIALNGMWRTHPRWALRRRAFDAPVTIFVEQALPMFVSGAATVIVSSELYDYFTLNVVGNTWVGDAIGLAVAVMAAGTAGLARWRAVLYSLQTGNPVTSGAREGLSFGVGMMFGTIISRQVTQSQWLPAYPAYLVLAIIAGTAFVWWTTQCAHAWLSARRRHPVILALAPVALASCVVLWAWFLWWSTPGTILTAYGGDAVGWRAILEQEFPGLSGAHQGMLLVIGVALFAIPYSTAIAVAAPAALCLVPVSAWLMSRPVMPARRPLIAATLGGLVGWSGAAIAMAYMHTWQAPHGAQSGLFGLIYLAWVFTGLTAGMLVAAVVSGDGKFSLVTGTVAAEFAALLGFAGWFVLASSDGCLGTLNTMATQCEWRPSAAWDLASQLLGPVSVTAPGAALAGVTIFAAVRKAARRVGHGDSRSGGTRNRIAGRRIFAATLVLVILGAGAEQEVTIAQSGPGSSDSQNAVAFKALVQSSVEPAPRLIPSEVVYWYDYGGHHLIAQFGNDTGRLSSALLQATATGTGQISDTVFRPLCARLIHDVHASEAYFPIPDPDIQSRWKSFMTTAGNAGNGCMSALSENNGQLFIQYMKSFVSADGRLVVVGSMLKAVTDTRGTSG